jgi:hypothetical protein
MYIEIPVANTYISSSFAFAFVNLGDGRLGQGGEVVVAVESTLIVLD